MILVILFGLLLRVLVGFSSYSGEGTPKMFGDYEAQRHWMEITYNLPVDEWYRNTTDNDLQYWGLDYPPLTAYHSWICGALAHTINPSFVALNSSRGYESPDHKLFMRLTVLFADILTFFLPTLLLVSSSKTGLLLHKLNVNLTGYAVLTYPALILIDHGHFQYNCVSLGLVVASYWALCRENDLLSAVFFCLALNYKQMTLYYALPIFAYFLSKCAAEFRSKGVSSAVKKFTQLSVTVLVTFVIVWWPFIFDKNQVLQVVRRLFPLDRGVFEDKVSNFWCVVNVVFKTKNHFTNEQTALICAALTFLSVLPSCVHLMFRSGIKALLYALFNCSMGFFLFSFQVHEKSILLVALPALLLFELEPFHSVWFLIISTFSLLPLLIKDHLVFPFISLVGFYVLSLFSIFENKKLDIYETHRHKWSLPVFKTSMAVAAFLAVSTYTIEPPQNYPDLFPLLISAYSAVHFGYFLIYFYCSQFYLTTKTKLS